MRSKQRDRSTKNAGVFISREQSANTHKQNVSSVIQTSISDVRLPESSPFNVPEPNKRLRPCSVQVSGAEPMRDDCYVYERALQRAGARTKLDIHLGVPNWHSGIFPCLQASKKAHLEAVHGVGWLLVKSADHENILVAMGRLV